MKTPLVGVYPGTFDPITNGHKDIVGRACKMLDKLVIAVARNAGKGPLFTIDERVEMVRDEVEQMNRHGTEVEVHSFDSLLVHFCQQVGATVLVRGLRAVSDFEYEFQMASMNARLDAEIETVFLMAAERQQFISSRFVKEIGRLGGDISSFVGSEVAARLRDRFDLEEENGEHSGRRLQTLK